MGYKENGIKYIDFVYIYWRDLLYILLGTKINILFI